MSQNFNGLDGIISDGSVNRLIFNLNGLNGEKVVIIKAPIYATILNHQPTIPVTKDLSAKLSDLIFSENTFEIYSMHHQRKVDILMPIVNRIFNEIMEKDKFDFYSTHNLIILEARNPNGAAEYVAHFFQIPEEDFRELQNQANGYSVNANPHRQQKQVRVTC